MLPEPLRQAIFWASDAIFGPWTMALLFGTGIFLTFRLRFVQIVRFPDAVRAMAPVGETGAGGALSPFQSFMTALAATIGTGNIAGVATAVVTGGPGAVFWIWAYGFFATAIKFTEAVLGLSSAWSARRASPPGPMHYLRDGMKMPRLGWLYALIAGIAALTTTPFTQPNSIAVVWQSQFGIPTLVTGIIVAVLAWLVIIGGIKSIGRAAEKLAPLKVGLYLIGGLIVIVTHAGQMPSVLALILREAFSAGGLLGGTAGVGMMVAMRYGVARGVYANEAGYGTAAVAYATARSREPLQQGLNAVMEVFIVSFVTSSISALTILVTGSVAFGADEHRGGGAGLRHHHSQGRLDRRRLRVPLRLHDADRLGVLRRAVPRVRLRPARDRALPLGVLHPHRLRRHREGGPDLGLGRPHERPADLPEPRRRDRAERHRRGHPARLAHAATGRRRARPARA